MLPGEYFLNSPFLCQKWPFKDKKRGLFELCHYDFSRIAWAESETSKPQFDRFKNEAGYINLLKNDP